MSANEQKQRVDSYLAGISRYLSAYRKRESLTQNEMARKLDISLNRYREYEQNSTDNAKGIPLDLLLRIAALEGTRPQDFVAILEDDLQHKPQMSGPRLDPLEERLVKEFRKLSLSERRKFVESFALDDETDKLVPNQLRWFVRIYNQLVRLPYASRMKIEREVLEGYMASSHVVSGSEEHAALMTRLKTLLRYYFSNFGDLDRS
jgi:transcriptional regulator with XRE-family HTH domain